MALRGAYPSSHTRRIPGAYPDRNFGKGMRRRGCAIYIYTAHRPRRIPKRKQLKKDSCLRRRQKSTKEVCASGGAPYIYIRRIGCGAYTTVIFVRPISSALPLPSPSSLLPSPSSSFLLPLPPSWRLPPPRILLLPLLSLAHTRRILKVCIFLSDQRCWAQAGASEAIFYSCSPLCRQGTRRAPPDSPAGSLSPPRVLLVFRVLGSASPCAPALFLEGSRLPGVLRMFSLF